MCGRARPENDLYEAPAKKHVWVTYHELGIEHSLVREGQIQ